MIVLDAGGRPSQLRFLPDGRLLVGLLLPGGERVVEVWPLPGGTRVRVALPDPNLWHQPNQLAVHPSGDRFHVACGTLLLARSADGAVTAGGPAHGVIASPDGARLVVSRVAGGGETALVGLTLGGETVWEKRFPHPEHQFLAGFADADRFLVVGGYARSCVTAYSFAAGSPTESTLHPTRSISKPQLSPDGRHLVVIGHGSLYVYAATLGKPRQIKAGQSFGNFVGFAFHPAGRTLAVIHGGPTLVKLYDMDTLTLRTKLNWKVGKLTCVGYSADGQLAAVGTDDGRVVVWDADE